MLIEIHMIKNFAPTNLNRDETGSPKTCFFGGAQRGRISSQSLKHAWRRNGEFSKLPLGIRTRYLPELITEELKNRGISENYLAVVKKKVSGFGNKDGKENEDLITSQIMFFAKEDIDAVADVLEKTVRENSLEEFKEIGVKKWQAILKEQIRPITLDMALFGRMITDDSFKDVEASLQAAHAISTHTVNQESDFFTAVDDLKEKYGKDAGSAMMDDTDFNSCCYYFYISLDTDQLYKNAENSPEVKKAIPELMPSLLEAIAYTNPSGKQNSFAGHSLPALICVERKEKKVPVSYVNAFEKPIRSNAGYTLPSIKALAQTIDQYDRCFILPIEERLWFSPAGEAAPQKADTIEDLPELSKRLKAWLKEV